MYSSYDIDSMRDVLNNLQGYSYGVNAFSSMINLAVLVLTVIAYWMVFEKAGEAGWKALIPFYNEYILYKVSGKKNLFWWQLACQILGIIASIVMVVAGIFLIISLFGGDYDYSYGLFFGSCAVLAATAIAGLVLRIFQCIGLTKAFGISGGYAVGLVLIPVVFYCILAFSSNMRYVGADGETWNEIPGDPSNPYFQ